MNLKRLLSFLVVLLAFHSNAQTADEIINKYIAAIGGKPAIDSVKAVKMTIGITDKSGHTSLGYMTIIRDKARRVDIPEAQSIISYYDTTGWILNPTVGIKEPQPMGKGAIQTARNNSSIFEIPVDYAKKGFSVSLEKELKLKFPDGAERQAYKIKFTNTDGRTRNCYFDAVTSLLVKIERMNGDSVLSQLWYSDYKTFGSVKFATSILEISPALGSQKTVISSIEINPAIDEAIFKKP